MGEEGTGGKGREWGKREGGCLVFSLSRHVNPKHNPCTCRMMLRGFWLESCEPINLRLSTIKLWNSSQITFAISTCLLDNSAENASVVM